MRQQTRFLVNLPRGERHVVERCCETVLVEPPTRNRVALLRLIAQREQGFLATRSHTCARDRQNFIDG